MASNFDMVKRMRWGINDGVTFEEFYEDQNTEIPKGTLKRLWKKARKVSGDEEWQEYLSNKLTVALTDMARAINELYEEGVSETTLSTLTGIDVKSIASFLK